MEINKRCQKIKKKSTISETTVDQRLRKKNVSQNVKLNSPFLLFKSQPIGTIVCYLLLSLSNKASSLFCLNTKSV